MKISFEDEECELETMFLGVPKDIGDAFISFLKDCAKDENISYASFKYKKGDCK